MFLLLASILLLAEPGAAAPRPSSSSAAAQSSEPVLRTAAVGAHATARKSRAAADFEAAEAAYRAYFTSFPDSAYAYDMHYAYAELLYAMKRYPGAYDEYQRVVALDPAGSHSKFCAESAIFAADEVIRAKGAGAASTAPVPLTSDDQRLLDACDVYLRFYPNDPKAVKVEYRAAYLLYSRGQFSRASERFLHVVHAAPTSEEAEEAANLVLDSLVSTRDWTGTAAAADAFLAIPGLGTPEFRTQTAALAEHARAKEKEK